LDEKNGKNRKGVIRKRETSASPSSDGLYFLERTSSPSSSSSSSSSAVIRVELPVSPVRRTKEFYQTNFDSFKHKKRSCRKCTRHSLSPPRRKNMFKLTKFDRYHGKKNKYLKNFRRNNKPFGYDILKSGLGEQETVNDGASYSKQTDLLNYFKNEKKNLLKERINLSLMDAPSHSPHALQHHPKSPSIVKLDFSTSPNEQYSSLSGFDSLNNLNNVLINKTSTESLHASMMQNQNVLSGQSSTAGLTSNASSSYYLTDLSYCCKQGLPLTPIPPIPRLLSPKSNMSISSDATHSITHILSPKVVSPLQTSLHSFPASYADPVSPIRSFREMEIGTCDNGNGNKNIDCMSTECKIKTGSNDLTENNGSCKSVHSTSAVFDLNDSDNFSDRGRSGVSNDDWGSLDCDLGSFEKFNSGTNYCNNSNFKNDNNGKGLKLNENRGKRK
jgi:hypothetical protein